MSTPNREDNLSQDLYESFMQQNFGSNLNTQQHNTNQTNEQQNSVPSRKFSTEEIKLVQSLIERCLRLYMSQSEAITALHIYQNIEPSFINLVWQKLEEQNPEFFRAYNIRLQIKEQISNFNFLVNQQAYLMQKQGVMVNTSNNIQQQRFPTNNFQNVNVPTNMQQTGFYGQSDNFNIYQNYSKPNHTAFPHQYNYGYNPNMGGFEQHSLMNQLPISQHTYPQAQGNFGMRNISQLTVHQNSYTVNMTSANTPTNAPMNQPYTTYTSPTTPTTPQPTIPNHQGNFVYHQNPQAPIKYQTKQTVQINTKTVQSGVTPVPQPTVPQNVQHVQSSLNSSTTTMSTILPGQDKPPTAELFENVNAELGLPDGEIPLEDNIAKYLSELN